MGMTLTLMLDLKEINRGVLEPASL